MISSIFLVFLFVGLIFASFRAQVRMREEARNQARLRTQERQMRSRADAEKLQSSQSGTEIKDVSELPRPAEKFLRPQPKIARYVQWSLPILFISIGCGLMLANVRLQNFSKKIAAESVRFEQSGIFGNQILRMPTGPEFQLPMYFSMQIPKPQESIEVACRATDAGLESVEELENNCVLGSWLKLTEAGIMLFLAGSLGGFNLYFRRSLQAKLDRSFQESAES